jgi:tetratricopeptide (TPR) repeat protein
MAQSDWFQNERWSQEIEQAFFAKLARARNKDEYLRIQAHHLTGTHPDVALRLLTLYFEQATSQTLFASAYVTQAEASLSLGDISSAVSAYEAALAREAVFPNVKTNAEFDLPFLIATRKIESCYYRALEILAQGNKATPFPVLAFKFHAAMALIYDALRQNSQAKHQAALALRAASSTENSFRHHKQLGLVGESYSSVRKTLEAIARND